MNKYLILFLSSIVTGGASYIYYLKLKADYQENKTKQAKLQLELKKAKQEEWERRILIMKIITGITSIGVGYYYFHKLTSKITRAITN